MRVDAQQAWALVKTAIFTVIVPYTVGFWLPVRVHRAYTVPSDTGGGLPLYAAICGYPVLSAGVALYLWCAWNFAVRGRGTPAPIDAPRILVVQGPYRYVRNPMYVAVLALVASRAILWRSSPILVYLAFVATCFHLFIMVYEEPRLRSSFGSQYEDYCRRVHRWLPRLKPAA